MAQTTAPTVPQVYSGLDNVVSASVGGGSRPQPPSPSPPSGVANGGSVWKNIPAPSIRSSTYFASGASGASVSRDVPVSSRSRDEQSSDFRRDAFAAVAVPSPQLHSPSSREGGVFSSLSPPPLTPPPPSFQQQAGSDRQQGAIHPAATALDIPSPVIASYGTLSGPVTVLKSVDPPIPAIVVPIVMGNNNPVASAAAGHFKINLDAPFSVDSSMSASASMKNLDEVAEGTAEEEDDATLDPLTASTVGRTAAPALAGFPAAATARASRSRNSSKSATTTPESATAAKSARASRRRVRKASGTSGAADEALRAETVNGLSMSGPPVSSLSFGASVTSAGGAIAAGPSVTPTASSATPPRSAEQILEQRGLSTLLQEFVTACAQEMPVDVLAFMAEWSVRRLTSQRVGPSSRGAASSSGGAATPRGGSGTVFPASTIPTNTTTVSSARRPSGGGRSSSATPSAAMDLSAPRLNASVLAAGAASASPSTSAVMGTADGHTLTPQERQQQQQVMRPPTDTSPLSVASPPRHHHKHRRHSTGTTAPQQHQSPQPPSSSPAAAWQGGSHPRSQRYGHAGGGAKPSEVDASSQHRSASNAGVAENTTTTLQHSHPPLVSLVTSSSGNGSMQPQPPQPSQRGTLPTASQQQAPSPAALGGWSVPGRPPLSAPRAESVASSSAGLITLHQVSSGVGLVTLAPHAPPMAGNVFTFPRPGTASSATHSASRVRAVLAVVLAASDSNKEELLSALDVVTTAAGAHFTFNQSTGSFLSPSAAASPRTLPVGAANVTNVPTESSAMVAGSGISGAVSPNRLSRQNTGTALADGTPPTAINNDSFGATVRTLMTNGGLGGGMTPGLRSHYESARAKLKDVENLALMPFESTRHAGAAVLFADLPGTMIDDDFVRLTSAADVAVLVVSVRTALKDMSQRRHGELYNRSLLAFSLGVKRVCLVLTDLRASASSAAVAMPQSQPPPPPPPTNGWANRSTSSIVTGTGNQSSGQWHLVDAVESEARLMLSRCGFEGNAVQCVRGASDLDAIVSAIHRLPPLARVRYVPEQCARLTATLMVLYGQGISPGDELVLHCLGPFRARVEALPSLLDRHTRAVTESNVAALRLNQVAAVRLVVTHVPTAAHGRGTPLARTASSGTANNNNNAPTTTVAISAPIVVYGGGRVLAMGHVTDLETLDEEDGDDGDDFAITGSGR